MIEETKTDDTSVEQVKEWEYRNITCRVYRIDDIEKLGYIRIGDEWKKVVESDDVDRDVTDQVEVAVDSAIRSATRDETVSIGYDPVLDDPEPVDPFPAPYHGDPPEPHDRHRFRNESVTLAVPDGTYVVDGEKVSADDLSSLSDGDGYLDQNV